MPIRPENLARYPADWAEISLRTREAAGHRCEFCGIQNGALGAWVNGLWHQAWPNGNGEHDAVRQGSEFRCVRGDSVVMRKVVRVVLTVAHLNHMPEDCRPENLKALCQRCHNVYDLPHRRAGMQERARASRALGDLF